MSRVLKLTLAYDGTRFVGWQRQPNGVSIQALLEDSLARIEGSAVTVIGAGRTDAGVHALGQVASVSLNATLDADSLRRALNATLPEDVRVLSVEGAADGFNARFDAREKTYRYQIVSGDAISPFDRLYAWHVAQPLNVDAMRAAAESVAGTHDFAAFQAAGSTVATTTRTIRRSSLEVGDDPAWPGPAFASHLAAGFGAAGRWLTYEVSGDGFLRYMVRTIAGTLVDIGSGRWPPGAMGTILASRDRARAGPTAPAHGLFLVRVDYRPPPAPTAVDIMMP